ncbi:ubiquinone biosynthesis O-methyltransferase-like [Mercenaria mercenaria]|uniref:ubiquinone biosynthesis O-methyltransferase-like n=1 Tax=Mercenaria mercenaria TaxID=6596 RepID=UPI00234E777B|nr:ubiquinone biosynthesis O-methyltransferase-like [Mercenaria mercenaria]
MAEEDYKVWLEAVCRPGVCLEESQKAYRDWASTYDEDAEKYKYDINSIKIASILKDYFQEGERGNVRILDVGAGTGLVAKQLKKYGFEHIDALEPSEDMLNEARKNNLYENYFVEFISGTPSSLPANSYDVLTGGGIYATEAHVPAEAILEMIRLVKPGGVIILVGSYTYIRTSKNYDDLEPLMGRLEVEGKWKKLIHEIWTAESAGSTTVERITCCYRVI